MDEVPFEEYLKNVERRVRELAETHPVIQRSKIMKCLTEKIFKIYQMHYMPQNFTFLKVIYKHFTTDQKVKMVEFIKHILGLVKIKVNQN